MFSNIIKKANTSSDTQLVRNLNTAVAMGVSENGNKKAETAYEAMQYADENGYDVAKIVAKSDNKIAWSVETGEFVLIDTTAGTAIYPTTNGSTSLKVSGNEYNYFVIVSKLADAATGYSVYAGIDWTETDVTVDGVGFDAGNNSLTSVTYKNTKSVAHNVVLRTNGGKLVVEDTTEGNKQIHYGTADEASITTATTSFHSFGFVDNTDLLAGKVVAEEEGVIILNKAAEKTSAIEENGGTVLVADNAEIAATSADSGIAKSLADLGYTVNVADGKATLVANDAINEKKGQAYFAGGKGTEDDPWLIENVEQLQNITKFYSEYHYYKVIDSTIDCSGMKDIQLHGSFDGNKVAFTGLSHSLFHEAGYQNNAENMTIKNFTVTVNDDNGQAAVVRNLFNGGTTTFENITVNGSIEGSFNIGSFYNYGTANYNTVGCDYTVNFKNCKSTADLICTSGNTCGGFIGHAYEGNNNTFTLNIDANSDYTGKIYTKDGNGGHYEAMNSNGTLVFNGTSISRYGSSFTAYNKNVKIVATAATKESDGYKLVIDSNTVKVVVTVTAQLDAYQGDTKIQSLSGITMVLGSKTIDNPTNDTIILDTVNSATIKNGAKDYGYSISNGVLTANVASSDTYKTGTIRLQVVQYDANGNIISCGTTNLYTIE